MSKALLSQLIMYQSDNNIRRNIGSFSANVANSNGAMLTTAVQLLPADTYTYTPPAGNKACVLYTDVPLTVTVTFAGGGGFTKLVTSMLYLDIEVSGLTLVNPDLSLTANVSLIIG